MKWILTASICSIAAGLLLRFFLRRRQKVIPPGAQLNFFRPATTPPILEYAPVKEKFYWRWLKHLQGWLSSFKGFRWSIGSLINLVAIVLIALVTICTRILALSPNKSLDSLLPILEYIGAWALILMLVVVLVFLGLSKLYSPAGIKSSLHSGEDPLHKRGATQDKEQAPKETKLEPKKSIATWKIIWGLVWITAVALIVLWTYNKWNNRNELRTGVRCLDADGSLLAIHRETFTKTSFKEKVPKGCAVLVVLPDAWPEAGWSEQQIGTDHKWQIAFKPLRGLWQGPYGWNDGSGQLRLPKIFLMEGTQDNEEVLFAIDHPSVMTISNRKRSPTGVPIYTTEDGITVPKAVVVVKAKYTDAARKAHFTGAIQASVLVGKDGRPQEITILGSPGFGLEEKVAEAIQQWRFQPATKDGFPVATVITVDVQLEN